MNGRTKEGMRKEIRNEKKERLRKGRSKGRKVRKGKE
jgi:hypothetical protein